MTPLEAVARAIAKCGGTEWDCDPKDPEDVYMGMACAALAALRDADWPYLSVSYNVKPADAIRAMLDAVLEEG